MQIAGTRIIWYSIAIVSVVLDQITKMLVVQNIALHEAISVVPGFDLILRYNPGASFNFLAEASGWQRWFFVGLAAIMSIVMIVWLARLDVRQKIEGLGLAFILGGAIGNLIDRLLWGHVIDFILLYYKDWEYPAFNIADSAICLGVALLGFSLLQKKPNHQ